MTHNARIMAKRRARAKQMLAELKAAYDALKTDGSSPLVRIAICRDLATRERAEGLKEAEARSKARKLTNG